MGKMYEYDGEKFEVSEPKDCKIRIEGRGQIGEIRVNETQGKYHVSVPGWADYVPDMKTALDACCAKLVERSKLRSEKELCGEMSAFYDGLS